MLGLLSLEGLVSDVAGALKAIDAERPTYTSRTGRAYRPGIGPFSEDAILSLVLLRLRKSHPECYAQSGQGLDYPRGRQRCDLWIGDPAIWAIEAKLFRLLGDNGKADDTAIKNLLSPYPADRSALADCAKLVSSGFQCRKALLVIAYEDPSRPSKFAVEALEVLARTQVVLGPRAEAAVDDLVHPVHSRAYVYAWEV